VLASLSLLASIRPKFPSGTTLLAVKAGLFLAIQDQKASSASVLVVCGRGNSLRASREHVALYASSRSSFESVDGAVDCWTDDFGRIRVKQDRSRDVDDSRGTYSR
jgi:hypothetical protein